MLSCAVLCCAALRCARCDALRRIVGSVEMCWGDPGLAVLLCAALHLVKAWYPAHCCAAVVEGIRTLMCDFSRMTTKAEELRHEPNLANFCLRAHRCLSVTVTVTD